MTTQNKKEITIPIFKLTSQKEFLLSIQIGKGKYLTGNPFPQKSNTYSNNYNFNIDLRDEKDLERLKKFIPNIKTMKELQTLKSNEKKEIKGTTYTKYIIHQIYKTLTDGKGKEIETQLKESTISIKLEWTGGKIDQIEFPTKKEKKETTKKNKELDLLNDIEL